MRDLLLVFSPPRSKRVFVIGGRVKDKGEKKKGVHEKKKQLKTSALKGSAFLQHAKTCANHGKTFSAKRPSFSATPPLSSGEGPFCHDVKTIILECHPPFRDKIFTIAT